MVVGSWLLVLGCWRVVKKVNAKLGCRNILSTNIEATLEITMNYEL
jgi:hypothetical protein